MALSPEFSTFSAYLALQRRSVWGRESLLIECIACLALSSKLLSQLCTDAGFHGPALG